MPAAAVFLDAALPIDLTPPFEEEETVPLLETLGCVHLSRSETAHRVELAGSAGNH